MAGQLYRSQQETWSFVTGNNANAAALTKTDFSGGQDLTEATASVTITNAGSNGDTIEVKVDKGSGDISIGTYTVQTGDSIEDVRDGLLADILANVGTTEITPSPSSTDEIILTPESGTGANANAWTVTIVVTGGTTATSTNFSGGIDQAFATATITVTDAGVEANVIFANVDKGIGDVLLGSYIVVLNDTTTIVKDGLKLDINDRTPIHDIVGVDGGIDEIVLFAPLSEGASANAWTVSVSVENNVIEPQHNETIKTANIFPFPFPLKDTLGAQVKATQSVDAPHVILLSTGDWYVTDLKELDWLYIQGEKRQVIHIFPSLQAVQIKYPFTAEVIDEDVYISYPDQHRHIKITAIGTSDTATVDNVPLKSGSFVQYDNNGGILPMVYDASGENQQLKFEVGF